MTFEFDLSKTFDFRLPYSKSCTLYVTRCDSTVPFIRYTTLRQPRGLEELLYKLSAFKAPEDTEEIRVVNPTQGTGKLVLEVITEPYAIPTPTTKVPEGGMIKAGQVTVGTTAIRLPSAKVMEGRDVVVRTDAANTAVIYINGFPLSPGESAMVQVADLADIELVADAADQKAYYLAEVRG